MKKKHFYAATLLVSFLFAGVQPSAGTIFIPTDTSIGTWDSVNRIYTLTTDVSESIQIDEDDLTLDGNGHTVTGSGSGNGVYLYHRTGVTIKNLNVQGFKDGIRLIQSSDNTLIDNTASSNNQYGIYLYYSCNYNTLTGNTASGSQYGIRLYHSSNNTLAGNTASNNWYGIYLIGSSNYNTVAGNTASSNLSGIVLNDYCDNNTLTRNTANLNKYKGIGLWHSSWNHVYRNNLINNLERQAIVVASTGNVFNLDKPMGGNYWSDHTGPDDDGDGFVDSPYVFSGGQDNLPWVVQDGWDPLVQIEQLIAKVTTLNIQQGIANSLDAKLDAVSKALDDVNQNNNVAAINALGAFINAVEAQRGNKIPEAEADALIAAAQQIIAALSGV